MIYTRITAPTIIDPDVVFLDTPIDALRLWKAAYFILGIKGNIIYADKVENIRIESPSRLNVFTKRARKYPMEYEKIYVFDDYSLQGLAPDGPPTQEDLLEVRDWFDVKSGMKHEHKLLTTDSKFVNKIIFYPSERIDGNHNLKDAVAISYLTKEQLGDCEYSDINARFKALYVMKKAGIRGTSNGKDPITGNTKHYSLKMLNSRRDVVPKLKKYKSYDKISFMYLKPDDVLHGMELNNASLKAIYNYGI